MEFKETDLIIDTFSNGLGICDPLADKKERELHLAARELDLDWPNSLITLKEQVERALCRAVQKEAFTDIKRITTAYEVLCQYAGTFSP